MQENGDGILYTAARTVQKVRECVGFEIQGQNSATNYSSSDAAVFRIRQVSANLTVMNELRKLRMRHGSQSKVFFLQ